MLSSQHSGRPIPFVLAHFLHRAVLLALVLLQLVFIASAQDRLNLSIPLNSTQIVYTPFLCNATEVLLNPQTCAGAWQTSNLSDGTISSVSTTGPSSASGNIIPQIFFPFRASDLFLTTLPTSNATVNITISASGTAVSTIFESGTGSATIVNLPENEVALLTITFIPSGSPTILELESLQINVPANVSITSILPSATLPPSASLPSFILPSPTASASSTPTPTSRPSNQRMIAQAVGITVGLGVGLTAAAALVFYWWRRRRRKQRRKTAHMGEEVKSEWSEARAGH